MTPIASRYEAVRRQVHDAADVSGRGPDEVTIVVVTKTVGIPEIRMAMDAGARDFGENRVQEFFGKYGLFPDVDWHFIGSLQTNKVKDVIGRACLIHSVDSGHLLAEIGKRAEQAGVVQPVLLQVNVSGEGSKHGFACDDVREALVEASRMPQRGGSGADDDGAVRPPRGRALGVSGASGVARLPQGDAVEWCRVNRALDGHEQRLQSGRRGGRDHRAGRWRHLRQVASL